MGCQAVSCETLTNNVVQTGSQPTIDAAGPQVDPCVSLLRCYHSKKIISRIEVLQEFAVFTFESYTDT